MSDMPRPLTAARLASLLLLAALSVPLCAVPAARAATPAQSPDSAKTEALPPFHEYRGVTIGMSADEARRKLGQPADKGDKQDFYSFSDTETAQVFYDDARKVYAISIIYLGTGAGVPACKAVLGTDAETNPDGSAHKMIVYPKAGYWVAYSRTSGDSPMTTITMQKK